jgi:hypothetical protein
MQPTSAAALADHLIFIEGQIVVICFWFACIVGAICGYALGNQKHGNNSL